MSKRDRSRWKRLALISMLWMGCLPGSACTMQLRDGALSGASGFLADATYTLLANLLPFELTTGGGGGVEGGDGGGGDPFSDVPLQM